jgi:glycosyltransferase 2 family protein
MTSSQFISHPVYCREPDLAFLARAVASGSKTEACGREVKRRYAGLMQSTRVIVRGLLGTAIGAVLLWLAVRDVDTEQAWAAAHSASLVWILIGMALYFVDILLRIARWQRLLRPTMDLSYPAVAEALVVGYAVNNLLPARLGEVFRADYLKRRQGLSRSAALGTIAIERLCDGVIILSVFIAGLCAVNAASRQVWTGLVSAAAVAGVGLLVVILLIAGAVRWHTRIAGRFAWLQSQLAAMARSISSLSLVDLRPVFLLSVLIWFIEAHAIDSMMRAFGVTVGWSGLCVVVGAASLSALLPSAPGYAGSLQIAFVLALSTVGVPAPLGLLSATATQIFLLGSLTLVGMLILAVNQFRPQLPPEADQPSPRPRD